MSLYGMPCWVSISMLPTSAVGMAHLLNSSLDLSIIIPVSISVSGTACEVPSRRTGSPLIGFGSDFSPVLGRVKVAMVIESIDSWL